MLNSPVFYRTLLCTLFSILLVAVTASGFYTTKRFIAERETPQRLLDTIEALLHEVEQYGIAHVIEDNDGKASNLWTEDDVVFALEEDALLLRIVDQQERTVRGFGGIDVEAGPDRVYIEHELLDQHPATALRHSLDDQHDVIVARFLPDHLYDLAHELSVLAFKITLALIFSGLITAWVLTRLVTNRLSPIVSTASNIGEQGLENRIPVSSHADEFDRAATAVNEMLGRVHHLTRNMQHVSVGVAHDLKTPVSNIAGRLQLIERDIHSADTIQHHINAANEHIQTLRRTLDALLRLGEIEAGQRKAAFKSVSLSLLVQDMAESYIPVFEEDDKQLRTRIAQDIVVFGDAELLVQALNNLLENIIEHARDGAKAWVKLIEKDNTVILEVGDDGPGIPAPFYNDIFERFVQFDSSRSAAGNGLGLSLVKSIAELHGGQVRLTATEPGATFAIELPGYGELPEG